MLFSVAIAPRFVSRANIPQSADINFCCFTSQDQHNQTVCPILLVPENIHYMVINADVSITRLHDVRQRFKELGLPDFERIPGIIPTKDGVYDVPNLRGGTLGTYGVALAHRAAWKAIAAGPHEWSAIFEDDSSPVSAHAMDELPYIPASCDVVMFHPELSPGRTEICEYTSIMHVHDGYGTCGYLLHRQGAKRLLATSAKGFDAPLDYWLLRHRENACACTTKQKLVKTVSYTEGGYSSLKDAVNYSHGRKQLPNA